MVTNKQKIPDPNENRAWESKIAGVMLCNLSAIKIKILCRLFYHNQSISRPPMSGFEADLSLQQPGVNHFPKLEMHEF